MLHPELAEEYGKAVAAGICGAARKANETALAITVHTYCTFADQKHNRVEVYIEGDYPNFDVVVDYNGKQVAKYLQNAEPVTN